MGFILSFACSKCKYESDFIELGHGEATYAERVLATCSACKSFTSIQSDEALGDCQLCGARSRVVFTSFLTRPRPEDTSYHNAITQYQCPLCQSFAVEANEPIGLWD